LKINDKKWRINKKLKKRFFEEKMTKILLTDRNFHYFCIYMKIEALTKKIWE